MSRAEIEALIMQVEAASVSEQDRAGRFIGAAELVAAKGYPIEAYHLCRKALAIEVGDSETLIRVRRVLARLIPSYHISMMNDTHRNAAWEQALTRAIRPGMRAFEIGTGAGVLTLIAARAGARVYTCENDPVIATVAREIVALNGLTDRVTILEKRSDQIEPDLDLDGPAELLFCDIFSNSLLGFDPLTALADARRRLVTPYANGVPRSGVIRLALSNWQEYDRFCHIERSVRFDVSPMAALVPDAFPLQVGDSSLAVLSDGDDAFRFDFTARVQPPADDAVINLRANRDGEVNGIVQWIRLELDEETVLETPPTPGSVSFVNLLFYPLLRTVRVRNYDVVSVHVKHDGRRLTIWA